MNEETQTQDTQEVKVEPLNSWEKAPTLLELKQDLQDSKPIHNSQITKIDTWLENLNVEGKAKVKSRPGSSSVVPKLIRKQAEWRYAALSEPFLSTDDLYKVKPVTAEDRKSAQQNQLVLNNQFNTGMDKVKFIDEYVRTAVDEGTVILHTCWEFEEEEYEAQEPVVQFRVNPEMAPMFQHLAQMEQENPSLFQTDVPDELKQAYELTKEKGVPIEPVIIGQKTVTKTRTIKNRPSVEICDYRNITIDPTAKGDVRKAGFIIRSFETCLSALKKEGKKYKNLDAINIEGSSVLSEPDHAPDDQNGGTFNFSDKARKKFVAYEYWGFWDIDGTGIVKPIVATWVGDTLIRMEENPFPDKALPFVVVQYLPVRKTNYGEPDGALLEDNQKILGAVTRGMIDIMGRSANGQIGIRKDMLDRTNRIKFDKGLDYEFNVNVDPRQGVVNHVYPDIPASAQFMVQLQNMEAESLTGVKSYSSGVSGASLGDVAAGIRGALDAASKRELGILRRLSNGIIEVGRKWISMNSEFLSPEEVIRITDEEFVTVRRDDLAGNFDLKLSISTAEEDNNKAQELAFMFQTIGPNGDSGMTKMILSDIARLRKMPDLAKKIEQYEPQPDPIAQQKAQLEVMLLEAQIEKERAMAAHYSTNAQLHAAKVGTESAKQGNIQSDTDQKNLDYVEQESGVTQERSKELHGEQARSQMELKAVEHQFNRETNREKIQGDVLKEYIKAKHQKTAKAV